MDARKAGKQVVYGHGWIIITEKRTTDNVMAYKTRHMTIRNCNGSHKTEGFLNIPSRMHIEMNTKLY